MWNHSLQPPVIVSIARVRLNPFHYRFLLLLSAVLILLAPVVLLCPRTVATTVRPEFIEQMATAMSIYQSSIVVIDVASKERHTLVEDEGYCESPTWSPDGGQVLFARFMDETSDIWSVDVKNRTTTKVYGLPDVDEVSPVFSPDGATLAYIVSHNHGQKLEIALLNMKTHSPQSMGQLMTLGGVDWISDTDLLFTAPTREPSRAADIQVVRAGDESLRSDAPISSPVRLLMSDYAVHRPSQQVCARGSFLGFGDIYWWKSMSAEPEQLTHDPSEDRDPAWSPDGKRIVFASDRTGDFDLYVLDIETGDAQNITQDMESDDLEPAWSPDGTRIAFRCVAPRNPEDIKGVVPAADEVSMNRMPGISKVGRYLDPVTITFHPWLPRFLTRRKFVQGSTMLGARGELVGMRSDGFVEVAGLAMVPAQDGIELYCDGWRQYIRYGFLSESGRITVDEAFLSNVTVLSMPREYDLDWPGNIAVAVNAPPAERLFLPKEDRTTQQLDVPGVPVLLLADGSLQIRFKDEDLGSGPRLYLVQQSDTVELNHADGDNGTLLAEIDRGLEIKWRNESPIPALARSAGYIVAEPSYWPYIRSDGTPGIPRPGSVLQPCTTDSNRLVVLFTSENLPALVMPYYTVREHLTSPRIPPSRGPAIAQEK
jgi:hypothetical protein